MTISPRFSVSALASFAQSLLMASGISPERAGVIAEILVEGDLLGHSTHGLQLLPGYLAEIEGGRMRIEGCVDVLRDQGATVAWNGRRLPGPWLVREAINLAVERAALHGTCTVTIAESHHIACLAAYLKPVTDRGMIILLASSDPAARSVVPFGGIRPLYSPNPIAAGFPTPGDPVLLDISMSTTTNGMVNRLRTAGEVFEHPWLVDGKGQPSRDPNALFAEEPGGILPLGGMDSGHKGFALGLLVEALSAALCGSGRADAPQGWGAAVFVQVIDPGAFGGLAAFERETGWFGDAVHATPSRPGGPPIRMPGERALQRRREQLTDGVELHRGIMPSLAPWAERLGVPVPPEPRFV